MPSLVESITPAAMKARAAEICRQRPDVQVLHWMLGEHFLYWVHSIGVASDGKLEAAAPPIPPEKLRRYVNDPRLEAFLWHGIMDTEFIYSIYSRYRRSSGICRVLDFGAGCGRMVRFLSMSSQFDVFASDVNPDFVDWCERHLRRVQTHRNDCMPPLRYRAGTFDLVYALSVFSHLPEEASVQWLQELSRILAPGGLLIATTHGIPSIETIKSSKQHQELFQLKADEAAKLAEELEPSGFLFRQYDLSVVNAAKVGTKYGNAFIHPNYIHSRWNTAGLKILAHLPGGQRGWQDATVLMKE
jgi:SAM-dependent methyltransferase